MIYTVKIKKPFFFKEDDSLKMWYNNFVGEKIIIDDSHIHYIEYYQDFMIPVVSFQNEIFQKENKIVIDSLLNQHNIRMSDTN